MGGRGQASGDDPLTIDLDSMLCETYGLGKEGARHHGYAGARGYHPLLAVAAGTGDMLPSRLREGGANTARGAAHFLRETLARVHHAGARGQLTMRADSGFYNHDIVSACRKRGVRFSITVRQSPGLRQLIEAIPEDDWTPIPYTMEGAADVAETTYVGHNHLPSGRFAANAAWLAVQVIAHNLARWTARIGLGEQVVTIRTMRRKFFSLVGRVTRSARRWTLHLPAHWPWEGQVHLALARLRALPHPA